MMDVKKLSASSYKKWSFCPHAFYIENVLNWRFAPGKSADIGTISHAVLEVLAQIKLARQLKLDNADTEIGKIDVNLFDIEEITEKIYHHYIKQDNFKIKEWKSQDFKDIKKYVAVVINHNNGQFNPLNRDIISTEQYLKLDIKEPWAVLPDGSNLKVTGFIDLVTKIDDNSYEITDYKTGQLKDFLSGEEINSTSLYRDIQLRLYHMAIAEKFGCEKNYLLTMFFLKFSKPITISFSCDDLEKTKQQIKERFLEIRSCVLPKLNKTWKCTKYCDYGKNTFVDTKIKPVIQFLDNGIAMAGQPCTICDQVSLEINRRGIEWTTENMKSENI